jgi:hypothetical protein
MIAQWISVMVLMFVPGDSLESLGRVSDRSIQETSGIVKSRKHRDVYWIHSDSGNPATIHAIRSNGSVIASFKVAAPNVDWEDISTDDEGHLYLADTGNNGKLLPLRAVYRIDEPDPFVATKRDLPVNLAIHFRFESKDDRFDCESLFVDGEYVYLIEKRRDDQTARLFRLPRDVARSLMKPARPEFVGEVPKFKEPATGASLSVDGQNLAVVSNQETRIYRWKVEGRLTLLGKVRYKKDDYEAICWDGRDLILATEEGKLFRIPEKAWRD